MLQLYKYSIENVTVFLYKIVIQEHYFLWPVTEFLISICVISDTFISKFTSLPNLFLMSKCQLKHV